MHAMKSCCNWAETASTPNSITFALLLCCGVARSVSQSSVHRYVILARRRRFWCGSQPDLIRDGKPRDGRTPSFATVLLDQTYILPSNHPLEEVKHGLSLVLSTMSNLLEKSVVERKGQKEHELVLVLSEKLWGIRLRPKSREASLFMEYYNAKTSNINLGLFYPTSHSDIVYLVSFLRRKTDTTLKEAKAELLATNPKPTWLVVASAEAASQALLFAASLLLMLSTSDWREDETLHCYVQRIQSQMSSSIVKPPEGLELRVTARSLNQIAGIELIWTSDLREHLNYDAAQRTLSLFRHASFLKDRPDSGYSSEYLRETASTLAILFPYGESPHRRWNRRVRKKAEPDVEVGISTTVSRNPQDYKFWSQQLMIIQNAFQRSRPNSLRQWYYDTRDGSQYYAFWFAAIAVILTLLFGLMQSITGILQVLKE